MIEALRYELMRIRTIASTYWTTAVGLGLCALVAIGFAVDLRGTEPPPAVAALLLTAGGEGLPFPVLGMAMALIGILSTGHEYRYGTILPTLTAVPRRSALLTAKIIVAASWAAATAAVSIALCWLAASVALGAPLPIVEQPIPAVLAGYLLLVIGYGVLGVALGQLTRSIPAAVAIVLVGPLVVEPVISGLAGLDSLSWLSGVVDVLPFGAAMQLVSVGLDGPGDVLGRWVGGMVFAVFVLAVLAAGWVLLERRDA